MAVGFGDSAVVVSSFELVTTRTVKSMSSINSPSISAPLARVGSKKLQNGDGDNRWNRD